MSHPLDGPRLKVERAATEFDVLLRAEPALWRDQHYEIVPSEVNPKTGKQALRVRIDDADLGFDWWSLQVSVIAHLLHSALDGLVFQLALLNTKTPALSIQFPILLCGKTTRRRNGNLIPNFEGTRRIDGRGMIHNLRPEHQAAIERFQPYKRGRGGRLSPLYLLKEVNNADKHRLIQVVGIRPRMLRFTSSNYLPESGRFRFSELKNGAKVGEVTPANVQVDENVMPTVAFAAGCPAVRNKEVRVVLALMVNEVAQIVESFSSAFA